MNAFDDRSNVSHSRESAVRAAAALVVVIASFSTVYALCRHFDARAGPAILAALIAITQSRRAHPLGWSRAVTAPIVISGTALAATGAALLLHANHVLGAVVFDAALFVSVWLRNFGERAKAVGAALALPFVALLIVPARADAPGGVLVDVALFVAAGVVALACATLMSLALRRSGVASSAATEGRTTPDERKKRAGLSVPTRMALQMALALGVAFIIGFTVFPGHWGWTVFTAFIVCSGARGRGDAAYKGALRLIGATAGTLAAAALTSLATPSGVGEAALIFVILFFGLWLRDRNYAYWAAAMTLVLALLSRTGGTETLSLLAFRLVAILIGALCAIAAVWFVFPIRTRDVVRLRLSRALEELDRVIACTHRAEECANERAVFQHRMGELDSVAAPHRWHRRMFVRATRAEHPADWIALAHEIERYALAVTMLDAESEFDSGGRDRQRGAIRRAIGASRRAIGSHGKADAAPDALSVSVALGNLRDALQPMPSQAQRTTLPP